MSAKGNIPKHWQIRKLGEVCKIINGKNQRNVVDPKGKYPIYGSSGLIGYANDYLCEPDTTIVGRKGTINKPIYVTTKFWNVDTAFGFSSNRGILNPRFLFFFCESFNFKRLDKSTTIPSLAKSDLEKIEVPIPPLPEQEAIVAKIEELLSELENGKQQLLTAQQQLKVYRQSLLKWAFEGKLTNKNVKEGELPKGWKILKLSELGTWKGGGTPSKQINKYWENGSNLWVTSKDMKIGVINDSINKITDEAILNSSANRIPKGAILFVMRSGILRHTFPVAIAGKDLTVNQDLQTLSPNGLATSEFIYWFIQAFNNDIRENCSKDGTTVESIETSSLKNYPFKLPPVQEQKQIVLELEMKLTVCEKIEGTISQSLQQAETLRQSILKKAFEGKLK